MGRQIAEKYPRARELFEQAGAILGYDARITGTLDAPGGAKPLWAFQTLDHGQRVTIATDRVRTAGTGADEHTATFAATAEDVTHVVVDGRVVFREGDRPQLGRDLADVIDRIWADA